MVKVKSKDNFLTRLRRNKMALSKAQRDGSIVPVTLWITPAEKRKLDREAKKQHRSRSSLMKQFVLDGVDALIKGRKK